MKLIRVLFLKLQIRFNQWQYNKHRKSLFDMPENLTQRLVQIDEQAVRDKRFAELQADKFSAQYKADLDELEFERQGLELKLERLK